MGVKTAGVGHFQIPTAPAAGTSVTSAAANTYTASAVQLIASTAAALYITGIYAEEAAVSAATYKSVQLMIGAGGSETNLGQYLIAPSTGSTVTRTYRPIYPPIPVAASQRISVKTADSVGSLATLISLECIAQTNVVDDGIAITTVTTVTNQLTAAAIATGVWQDATAGDFTTASSIGKALFISNIAPGAAGGHMISGSNAGTTTFGALTITGATTLTGNVALADGLTIAAPSTGNRAGLSITGNGTGAAAILTGGATGIGLNVVGGGTSGDGIKVTTTSGHGINLAPVGTNMHGLLSTGGNGGTSDGIKASAGTGGVDLRAAITGNVTGNLSGSVGSVTGAVGSVTGAVGSVTGLTASNLDATISSRMASYTQPTGFLAATFPATVASTTNITAGTITTATNLTNAPTAGDFTAAMKTSIGTAVAASAVASVTGNVGGNVTGSVGSVVGAVGSVTGSVGSVTGAVGSVTGNVGGNVVGSVASVTAPVALTAAYDPAKTAAQAGDAMTLTAAYNPAKTAAQAGDAMALTAAYDAAKTAITTGDALTEGYRANGATGTLPQLVYELLAHLGESSIAGTTKTINKLDHATAAETFTLDSATAPTSITRAT